jgi:hypothetical protein
MKKKLLLYPLLLAFFSCTKDPDPIVDRRIGNYDCIQINSGMTVNTSGQFVNYTDTSGSMVTISVSGWPNNNYQVSLPVFSFVTNSVYNNKYYSQCSNGPCPSLTFYAADSIRVYRKINNASNVTYVGKKQ